MKETEQAWLPVERHSFWVDLEIHKAIPIVQLQLRRFYAAPTHDTYNHYHQNY
jgi:hypothetical protein